MYNLVVVDMQPNFEAAQCDETTANVVEAVRRAKADGANIVLLEYGGYGPSRDEILDELGDYMLHTIETKWQDDGSIEVMQGLDKLGATIWDEMRVCGVNLGACVWETCKGLLQLEKNVVVLKKACNQPGWWGQGTDYHHENFQKNGIVLV